MISSAGSWAMRSALTAPPAMARTRGASWAIRAGLSGASCSLCTVKRSANATSQDSSSLWVWRISMVMARSRQGEMNKAVPYKRRPVAQIVLSNRGWPGWRTLTDAIGAGGGFPKAEGRGLEAVPHADDLGIGAVGHAIQCAPGTRAVLHPVEQLNLGIVDGGDGNLGRHEEQQAWIGIAALRALGFDANGIGDSAETHCDGGRNAQVFAEVEAVIARHGTKPCFAADDNATAQSKPRFKAQMQIGQRFGDEFLIATTEDKIVLIPGTNRHQRSPDIGIDVAPGETKHGIIQRSVLR